MPFVATLVSHPAGRGIAPALARSAQQALRATEPDWLSPGFACDLALPESIDAAEATARLRETLADAEVDCAVLDTASRRKRLLLADMDSTIIEQECIDELADEVGVKDRVASITERAMRGEIAFAPALRERVALLKGLEVAVIGRVLESRITLASGAKTLIATMRKHGAWTALISGGFEAFTGPIAQRVGFDEHQANRLIADGDHLAGLVEEPILGREAKADALQSISKRIGLELADTLAVGDGANDLGMIEIAGLGVALHAKPAVAAAAQVRVDHGDLTALLFLQGYRQTEFAT
ncbi:phosphoserine phosphatase SerB [Mesorhizobium sp. RP14(2022)]|uniref:Phosphoserine phosphatase n=1 Tax=Mesorhizobium liriopis TaxID=2953882 RepID=A0ABT1C5E0_9HYPH|nr:phosphoserine phosphatase SerB [Mesorhizobium liriopis]MCO6050034.1 phosphoserine phosphatase SerB [Mesorhizobium liriopis]